MPQLKSWFHALSFGEVLLYSLGAALVLQWVLSHVILRLARRTRTDLDEKIILSLRVPLFLTLVFLGAAYALKRLDPVPSERTLRITKSALVTIGVLFWLHALMRIANMVLDTLARRMDDFRWIQPRSLPLFDILTRLLLLGSAIYVLITTWEWKVTPWLASAGVIGIAVGFAAKDTLANLFAGIFILADAPYKLGDFILLGSGERGRVTDIGIRSTRLLTRDDIEITIPNSVIANSKIVNETGGPHRKRRVRITVGVAYGSDIDQVRKVLMEVAEQSGLAADHPAPRVRFREFGDSALTFQLMVWIAEPVLRGRAVDQLNTAVYKRFIEQGIEIPFPQRVVHLHDTTGRTVSD